MIRELTKNDLEEVNILLSSFNYSITEETFNSVFFKSLVYVDDKIKGVIVYSLIYDRIEIEYIIVDENYRKSKIGTKLIGKLEKENAKNITLEVRKSNETAINFYKNNGFRIEAIRKNYYKDEDGYLMLKELGE
jgi:ribosomal-protein-alanine N-acetyltransferase